MIKWFYGNSGSGKTTAALEYAKLLTNTVHLDGDDLRKVWEGLGYTEGDRRIHNWRVARLAKLMESQGFDVVISVICPYKEQRKEIQKLLNCDFVYMEGGKKGKEYPFEKS